MVTVANDKVALACHSVDSSYQKIVKLLHLGTKIVEMLFGEFGSGVVSELVFKLGVQGFIKVAFEVVHGKESLVKGQSADYKRAVIIKIGGLSD